MSTEEVVNFYHFTHSRNLEKVLKEGIKPLLQNERDISYEWEDAAPDGVVWLTSSEHVPRFFDSLPDLRITVRLPHDDPRLQHWLTWMQKHESEEWAAYDAFRPDVEAPYGYWNDAPDFWFYEGTITPDMFAAVDVETLIE